MLLCTSESKSLVEMGTPLGLLLLEATVRMQLCNIRGTLLRDVPAAAPPCTALKEGIILHKRGRESAKHALAHATFDPRLLARIRQNLPAQEGT